jgi:prophage regulatory protein
MRLISFEQLKPEKGIGCSRDHLRRKIAAGEFPKPISVSSARIAWIEAEIDSWLAERVAGRAA